MSFYGVIFQNNGVNTGNFSEIVGIGGNEQENGQMLFISTQEQTSQVDGKLMLEYKISQLDVSSFRLFSFCHSHPSLESSETRSPLASSTLTFS